MLKLINDSHEEIKEIVEFLLPYKDLPNFKGIDLLPYHKLGVNKIRTIRHGISGRRRSELIRC